jgi:hypothetical protein
MACVVTPKAGRTVKRPPSPGDCRGNIRSDKELSMAGVESRSLDEPDETRTPDKVTLHLVKLGGAAVGRGTFQPGWKWSESIKPIVGTESCQVHHIGVITAGRMHIVHEDGSETDISAGDVYEIQPGHDAWVVGDEAAVAIEFDPVTAASFGRE